jgi:transcriptional regulator with XRE-family HTH domain
MALEKNTALLLAFGLRVRSLRLARGLSMRDLCNALNIDVHQLSRVEKGQVATSIVMGYALAKVFEMPLSELFASVPNGRKHQN